MGEEPFAEPGWAYAVPNAAIGVRLLSGPEGVAMLRAAGLP